MNIITQQMLIDMVVGRWYQSYKPLRDDKKAIYEKLLSLSNPSAEDVNKAIGNSSWTELQCDNCKRSVDKVICMDVTHGEYVTYICEDCLNKALNIIRSEQHA